jgi:hypothetical protein
MAPSPGHLADPAPPAEDYFKSGHEQENGNEQVSRPLSSKHQLDDEDDEDDEEESRYSVPKKRDSKNTSQASPSKLDLSDGSDADSVVDLEDSQGEGYEESESDAIIDEVKQELQELQEHVIDLASLMNGTAPEVGDAPATDLTHLDDEKFKVRTNSFLIFFTYGHTKTWHGAYLSMLETKRARIRKQRVLTIFSTVHDDHKTIGINRAAVDTTSNRKFQGIDATSVDKLDTYKGTAQQHAATSVEQ